MGERENNLEIINSFLELSNVKLLVSKLLKKEKAYSDAIRQAYYSVYLVTRSPLLLVGESPNTHLGLLTDFSI
jgi:uncharacterized protein (UPF0332 family)